MYALTYECSTRVRVYVRVCVRVCVAAAYGNRHGKNSTKLELALSICSFLASMQEDINAFIPRVCSSMHPFQKTSEVVLITAQKSPYLRHKLYKRTKKKGTKQQNEVKANCLVLRTKILSPRRMLPSLLPGGAVSTIVCICKPAPAGHVHMHVFNSAIRPT